MASIVEGREGSAEGSGVGDADVQKGAGEGVRKSGLWRRMKRYCGGVGLEVVVGAILVGYMGLVQPWRYEAEVLVRVVGVEDMAGGGLLSGLMGGGGVGGGVGASGAVVRYLKSRELSGRFYREFGEELKEHFGSRGWVDPVNVGDMGSEQGFFEFYQRWVRVEVDGSGVVGVWLTDYDGKEGGKWLSWLMVQARGKVEEVSRGGLEVRVREEEGVVKGLKGELVKVEVKLAEFSGDRKAVFYDEALKSEAMVVAQLKAQLALAVVEWRDKSGYMSKGSGEVEALKGKVDALRGQIEELEKVQGGKGKRADVLEYAKLKGEGEILRGQVVRREGELEALRTKLAKTQVGLEVLSGPTVSDEGVYPKRGWNMLLVVLGVGVVWWMRRAGRRLS